VYHKAGAKEMHLLVPDQEARQRRRKALAGGRVMQTARGRKPAANAQSGSLQVNSFGVRLAPGSE
jgi:hypothetical protein